MVYLSQATCTSVTSAWNDTKHSNKSYQRSVCSTGKGPFIRFPINIDPKLLFAVDEMGSRKDQTTVRIQ
jgi:hypothetical protein